MKAELDPIFQNLRGSAGNFVYRKIRGKTVLSQRPVADKEPTAGQLAHRERFNQAVAYGKSVMGDEELRALYEAAAKRKDVPVFSLTIADFFNVPTINNIDFTAYDGKVGSTIIIHATDDFEVASVHVFINDIQGNAIESGNAVEESGRWRYTAKVNVPVNAEVVVKVVATDRPGGTAIVTQPL